MSNHFTGLSLGPPLGDQRLDLCDLYAFLSPTDPTRTVLILNANPTADALHPDAIYRLNIDNDGDALTDLAISYVFSPPENGRQTVRRLHRDRRGGPLRRSRRHEGLLRRRGVVRRRGDIATVRALHVLRRRSQRRVLLRLRRDQEPVRHQRRQELHRASPRWRVSVDRRGLEHRSQRVLDRRGTADQRARCRPEIRIWGRCSVRKRRPAPPCRPGGAPVGQQLLQHRRHQRGIQRQRARERSRALDRHVRPLDGAHRQLHRGRGDRRDRRARACCPTC